MGLNFGTPLVYGIPSELQQWLGIPDGTPIQKITIDCETGKLARAIIQTSPGQAQGLVEALREKKMLIMVSTALPKEEAK